MLIRLFSISLPHCICAHANANTQTHTQFLPQLKCRAHNKPTTSTATTSMRRCTPTPPIYTCYRLASLICIYIYIYLLDISGRFQFACRYDCFRLHFYSIKDRVSGCHIMQKHHSILFWKRRYMRQRYLYNIARTLIICGPCAYNTIKDTPAEPRAKVYVC